MNRKLWWRLVAPAAAMLLSLGVAVAVPTVVHASDFPSLSLIETLAWEGRPTNGPKVPVIRVTLDRAYAEPIEFTVKSFDGTAIAPDDYTPIAARVTIPAFARSVSIPIDIPDDKIQEGLEFFWIEISEPSVGTIAAGRALVYIAADGTVPRR